MANRIQFTFEINDKGKVKVDGITKGFQNLDTAINKVNADLIKQSDALKNLNKSYDPAISNAGLAGATLTELGRTISDLPFGIRGVANNLSQLSTLFITLVSKSKDGVKGLASVTAAFKALGKQLKGPLGIILIFQAVIALFDAISQNKIPFLNKKNKELEESFKAVASSANQVGKEIQTINDLIGESDEQGIFSVKQGEAIVKLISEELGPSLKDVQKTLEDLEDAKIEESLNPSISASVAILDNEEKLLNQLLQRAIAQRENTSKAEDQQKVSETIFKLEESIFNIQLKRNRLTTKQIKDLRGQAKVLDDIKKGINLFPEEPEETPLQRFAREQLEGFKKVEMGAQKHVLSMEEVNYRLAIIDADRLDVVATTTAAFASLLGERTAAGKAFAVATASIDTYAAANLALNDKTIPSTALRIVAAAGVIATGLANVKKILATDETGTSYGSTGAGATQQGSQAPIFNVVGQSGVNQLGQTIAAARSEPMRAYVVTNDITNAQELENKIIQQSSLG